MTKDEIFNKLKTILVDDFEIDEEKITMDANVVDDLDLDSIDVIDLIGKMKQFIPGKISPDTFNDVHTISDVIETIEPLTAG